MPGFASIRQVMKSFQRGFRLIDGGDLLEMVRLLGSANGALTAKAGGGAAGATLLSAYVNRVTTVASAADSVLLPPGLAGQELQVINAGANSLNVYPNQNNQYTGTNDTIAPNGSSTQANNPFAVAANATATFYCSATGQWKATIST